MDIIEPNSSLDSELIDDTLGYSIHHVNALEVPDFP